MQLALCANAKDSSKEITNKEITSKDINNNELFIQADSITGSSELFDANGNIILRSKDTLLNIDELFAVKLSNYEPLKNKKEGNGEYILNGNGNIRIRFKDGTFIYARSIFYNQQFELGNILHVHIFPKDLPTTQIIAKEIEKIGEDEYKLKGSLISICLPEDKILQKERELEFENTGDDVPLSSYDNVNDKSIEDIQFKRRFSPINIYTDELKYNSTTTLAQLKGGTFRVFGVPIFYMPYFSIHANPKKGDPGFLFPSFISMGGRQFGAEIPFYIPIKDDMDLVISRAQYFGMSSIFGDGTKHDNGEQYKLLDSVRMRENTTEFQFRHLISEKFGFQSFYQIEGMMTDKTYLVDDYTGAGDLDSNGFAKRGYRGYLDIKGKMQLTKSTFLDIDYLWASDKNLMYIYKFDTRPYKINTVSLFDVTERSFHSLDLVSFQSMLIPLQSSTIPIVVPIIRSEFDLKKDKFGGNFYFRNNFSTIQRDDGYDHTKFGTDIGYLLPYITDNGFKVTFESMVRGQFDNFNLSGQQNPVLAPAQNSPTDYMNYRNVDYIYGNYAGLMQNSFYISGNGSGGNNYTQLLNFNKLQVERPYLITSDLGETTIEPKVAFKYNPYKGQNIFIPNDETMGISMNQNNAFSLTQSGGFGAYEFGPSAVYGADFVHKFKNSDFEILGTIAHSSRMSGDMSTMMLSEASGFRQSMSDIMGNLALKYNNLSIGANYKYDTGHRLMREFQIYSSWRNEYISLAVNYAKFAREANIFNREMNIIGWRVKLFLPKNIEMIASGGYNLSNEPSPYFPSGKTGITNMRYAILHTISCFQYGFMVTQNNMGLANIPPIVSYRFVFKVNNIG